ncbi:nuclear transport factor 2 family protein [Nocardia carnea]|uniref:Nuclear transport factor 2 family protein n=1 Tax=Nocardia carnea TaxID=37328 RepID=A0ABW7TN13_9NOCA|nr:nuclear transport factor 2 family protein [Nocardia carnea]
MTSSSDSSHPGPAKPDRDAVADTVNRYTYALDDRDWALLDEVFAPDAVVRYGAAEAPAVRGRVATVAMIRSFLDRCGPSQHLLGNHVIDIDGDTASSICKARVLHIGAGENANITYECVGVYRDRLIRSAQGWRIVERTFVIDIELGDRHAVLGGASG